MISHKDWNDMLDIVKTLDIPTHILTNSYRNFNEKLNDNCSCIFEFYDYEKLYKDIKAYKLNYDRLKKLDTLREMMYDENTK